MNLQSWDPRLVLIVLSITIFTIISRASAYPTTTINQSLVQFIKESCDVTLYPRLCFNSLQSFRFKIHRSPRRLAHAALRVSLIHVNRTLANVSTIPSMAMNSKEAGAMRDCIETLVDSLSQIKMSMREFRYMATGNTRFHISNIQTWVSAAITDEETCKDGFHDIGHSLIGSLVRRKMGKIERLTSNSLALVNSYANTILPKQV